VTLNTIFLKLSKYNHGNQLLKTANRMEASNMIKIGDILVLSQSITHGYDPNRRD